MIAPPIPDPLWYDDLALTAAAPIRWVWHGYLASGSVTLLTSRWKAGKTTLLSLLLSRLGNGGELAGSAVTAGRAVVVSEEAPELVGTARRATRVRPPLRLFLPAVPRKAVGPPVARSDRPTRRHPPQPRLGARRHRSAG